MPHQKTFSLTRRWDAGDLRACLSGLEPLDAPHEHAESRDGLTCAAVLVPLILHPSGSTLLLTRRSEHLSDHPGQIAFPGGRCEAADGSAIQTALREAHEEVGLDPTSVQTVGRLPEYRTSTGFAITPIVGLIAPPFKIETDPQEVAEVFEVPLEFLFDPANHEREPYQHRGRSGFHYVLAWQGRRIWGATAGMIVSLHRLLAGQPLAL